MVKSLNYANNGSRCCVPFLTKEETKSRILDKCNNKSSKLAVRMPGTIYDWFRVQGTTNDLRALRLM
eukprot:scaffold24858_cov113-Cylindrotheca_fusiformis.AAC.1